MNNSRKHSTWIVAGALWMLVSGLPAVADDTELFVGSTATGGAQPNILFILDTSGSMTTQVITQDPYNPATAYAGACDASRVYWRSGTGNPPSCATGNWFNRTAMACDAGEIAFLNGAGRFTDRIARYDLVSSGWWDVANRWEQLSSSEKSEPVECEDDGGIHGDGIDPDAVYAMSGTPGQQWSNDPLDEVAWGNNPTANVYTVYDGNYLNWYYGPVSVSTRTQVMKDVTTDLLSSINGVNVGLMRFNVDQGGPVIHAMEDIATARPGIVAAVNALPASGWTPLSETLYEAGLYYRGAGVDYGNTQGPPNSIVTSRQPLNLNAYSSPLEFGCQKNFIVLLTDGEPTQDTNANGKIVGQTGFNTLVGAGCDGSGNGACLDDMAEYLFEADLSGTLDDLQNVVTYTIGFAIDLPILESTAQRGGGEYFTANDTATLSNALTNIVTSILDTQTTFTAPTVSVNSFNRTRNLNDLFVAVFEPSGRVHWPGNLKKYKLRASDSQIIDADGNAAIDPLTGFFMESSRSFWTPIPDGSEVGAGGAANQIPPPATRNVYTYLGSTTLNLATNAVDVSNGLIDDATLGIGAPGDPTRADVLSFARGADVLDKDSDGNVTEGRNEMGDPLHAQPVSVIYGGTVASPDIDDAVIYFATNDGYLHAVDPTTGQEKWAFIPPEFLPDLVQLYQDESMPDKHYGIDGNPTIQLLADNDGIIDPSAGEKAYLYFGMRRGGTFYYGLDVTDPDSPKLLWQRDGNSLPGVGQSWAQPVPTRINIQGATQNATKLALVIGGGYDPSQDALVGSTDSAGNAMYIIDSVSGDLLWHGADSGADKNFADMVYSVPAEIKVIDLDSDRFADRMYMADMGGQVWRFDIFNGQTVGNLVNGGVIAQLGGAPLAVPLPIDNRRFYYSPDVALVSDYDQSFIHIGVGSGHRARPNSIVAQDRFYALRDYLPFGTRTQPEYNAITPVTDANLVDVTDDVDTVVPPGSAGWRFELRLAGWSGEKVLAEARTFDNQIFFTTFEPNGAININAGCTPSLGTNRLYIMDVLSGRPVTNLDESVDPDDLTESDRYTEFSGSISSEVVFLFPSPDDENCVGDQCTPPPVACVDLFCFPPDFQNNPTRTFWSQENVY